MAFLLAVILLSCSLPGRLGLVTQTTDQNPTGSVATMTLQETQTVTPTDTMPTAVASPNTPTWSAYNYTCELIVGGGTMTMHLAWNDRSNSEDGYKVYRDQQVIATLPPNSTSYVDVAFVATGKKLSYSVEAFDQDWQASTSTITYGCQ